MLVVSSCLLLGCETHHHPIIECQMLGDPFEVSAAGYCTNYFFIDTSCASVYGPYFLSDPPTVDEDRRILAIEVWTSRLGSLPDASERWARAYLHLQARGGGYPDSLRSGIVEPGFVEEGPFVRLNQDQFDLFGNGYPGIIRLNVPVNDFAAVAVAYKRGDMAQFGEFGRDLRPDTIRGTHGKAVVLKLVKPRGLLSVGPAYREAWTMLVKSIYPTGFAGLVNTHFQLEVFDNFSPVRGERSILGQPLLAVLGLDRYRSGGMPGPDGVFDYRPGRTIDQLRGDIILPYLKPFDDGIRRYFASIGQPISPSSNILLPQLYDTTTVSLARRVASKYVFRGSTLHQ
jgi:hypothetical protein